MNRKISLKETSFYQLLCNRNRVCRMWVTDHKEQIPGNAEEYLAMRDELCEKGLCELDFDGKLHMGSVFSRLLYDLEHTGAILQLQPEGLWYIRVAVDILKVTISEGIAEIVPLSYSEFAEEHGDKIAAGDFLSEELWTGKLHKVNTDPKEEAAFRESFFEQDS